MPLALARAQGVYPQALGGAVLPRDIPNGAWVTVELTSVSSYTITVPACGTHFVVELQLLGDTVATEVNVAVKVNGDTTTGDYHWQRLGANNNVAANGEGTTFDALLVAAASAVSGYYSTHSLLFPEYRNSTRQKVCVISTVGELAALNQRIFVAAHKRQVAGVGTLIDPIQTIQLVPSAGNISGTVRWAALQR
jgi:hypothetical protein